MLYPFVEAVDGYAGRLTDAQWVELGGALRGINDARLPARLARRIPRETFSPASREAVWRFLARAETERFEAQDASELAAILRCGRERVSAILQRADQLGDALRVRPPPPVLCHGDRGPQGDLRAAPGHPRRRRQPGG